MRVGYYWDRTWRALTAPLTLLYALTNAARTLNRISDLYGYWANYTNSMEMLGVESPGSICGSPAIILGTIFRIWGLTFIEVLPNSPDEASRGQ